MQKSHTEKLIVDCASIKTWETETMCNSKTMLTPKLTYEVVSKIFRTDAVKIVKLTIRPISHRHPRSSSLPHIDTGPTVSFIFGTLPGSPFLSECQALSAIRPRPVSQWYQISVLWASISFLKIGRSHRVPNHGSTVGGGWWPFCFSPETAGWVCKCETERCYSKAARSVLAKVWGDVFARFRAVAAKLRSRTRNSQFGLLGHILCAQSPWRQREWRSYSWHCF